MELGIVGDICNLRHGVSFRTDFLMRERVVRLILQSHELDFVYVFFCQRIGLVCCEVKIRIFACLDDAILPSIGAKDS